MKWEYKVINFALKFRTEKKLNELGEEGWELVDVQYGREMIFKRPK